MEQETEQFEFSDEFMDAYCEGFNHAQLIIDYEPGIISEMEPSDTEPAAYQQGFFDKQSQWLKEIEQEKAVLSELSNLRNAASQERDERDLF